MPASQPEYVADELIVVTELDIPDVSRSLPKSVICPPPSTHGPVLDHGKRLLRFFVCIYAATMIGILVVVHRRDDRHVGIQQFFLACTAGFYIICYQVLSAKDRMKLWFKRNGPTIRTASIALAALVVSIPIALLFLAQMSSHSTPSLPKPAAMTVPPRVAETDLTRSLGESAANAVLQPTASPAHKPISTGVLADVRYMSDFNVTTVILDLNQQTPFQVHRISSPERIYLDLQNTHLLPLLLGKHIQAQDQFLRAIKVGQHEHQTIRVTLVTAQLCNYSVKWLPSSSQLLIELRVAQPQSQKNESGR